MKFKELLEWNDKPEVEQVEVAGSIPTDAQTAKEQSIQ